MKKSVITMLIVLSLLMVAGLVSCKNNTGAGEMPDNTTEDTIIPSVEGTPEAPIDTLNTRKDPVAP